MEELIAEHLMANLEIITEPELVGFWIEQHTDALTWARSCGILIQGEGHRQVGKSHVTAPDGQNGDHHRAGAGQEMC